MALKAGRVGVRPDQVDSFGRLKPQDLPVASATTLGGVKVGSGLGITTSGVLSANGYTLPPATTESLGGVIIGEGIYYEEDGTIAVYPELPEINEGDAGKVLTVSSNEVDVEWSSVQALPTIESGDAGKVLTVNSAETGSSWEEVASELPSYSSSDDGKALFVKSDGTLEWKVP